MSQADVVFKRMCEDILAHGTDNKGEEIRPHWEDGTPAYTLACFGVVNRYDLSSEFPDLANNNLHVGHIRHNPGGHGIWGLGSRLVILDWWFGWRDCPLVHHRVAPKVYVQPLKAQTDVFLRMEDGRNQHHQQNF